MKLYVRSRNRWINYLHDISEVKMFIDNYIPGTSLVVGDLALFNSSMRNVLLKFLEDNPLVDCYTSEDISDPVLLSRFVSVTKEPIDVTPLSLEEFKETSKDYSSAIATHLPNTLKLHMYHAPNYLINILGLL